MLTKLASMDCSNQLVHFIKYLLYERGIFTDSTKDEARLAFKGVPQGGVISPLLYTLHVADIANNAPKYLSVL